MSTYHYLDTWLLMQMCITSLMVSNSLTKSLRFNMKTCFFLIVMLALIGIDHQVFANNFDAITSQIAIGAFSTSCNKNPRTGKCEGRIREKKKKSGGCFPGTAEVNLISGKMKLMKDVKIGDNVLIMAGTFEPIIGFLDRKIGEPTNFITLRTNISSEVT